MEIRYFGKLTKEEQKWLEIRGRRSYSGGELTPIIFDDVMIGGMSWNLGGIDYIEFKPEYKGKGLFKYFVQDNIEDDGTIKFVTASDELQAKLSNYGDVHYNDDSDITTLKINYHS